MKVRCGWIGACLDLLGVCVVGAGLLGFSGGYACCKGLFVGEM